MDEQIDAVEWTIHRIRTDVDDLFGLYNDGKSGQLREHFPELYEAYLRFGDLLPFFRQMEAAE
jgi:hypothetical protein